MIVTRLNILNSKRRREILMLHASPVVLAMRWFHLTHPNKLVTF